MAKVIEKEKTRTINIQAMADDLAEKANVALKEMESFDQERADHIVHEMAVAALDQRMPLAEMAVEETGRGVYEGKTIKNIHAPEYIWHNIKHDKTVGVINEDVRKGLVEVAEPVSMVCGVTPTTNPASITTFRSMIALKTGNPIVFALHPSAQKSSAGATRVVRDTAIAAGAPENCIQWIEHPSIEAISMLTNHPDIAIVLATGGARMVESAYSTGKPALGVGPDNIPACIEKTAKIRRTINDSIVSKIFDNGMICASEQAAVVDKEVYTTIKARSQTHQVYIVKPDKLQKLEDTVMNEGKYMVDPPVVRCSAIEIAKLAGISVPKGMKMLIAELGGIGPDYPLSREKLSSALAIIEASSTDHASDLREGMLNLRRLEHTAVIYSENEELHVKFGLRIKACRVLVNTPSAEGGIGDIYNEMIPSLTLGCGSYGKNSISRNVSAIGLINVKTVVRRRNSMQ